MDNFERYVMTEKFKKMCEIYKIFGTEKMWNMENGKKIYYIHGNTHDFSEEAMKQLYEFETFGKGNLKEQVFNIGKKINGFAVGKKWLNVQVKSWLKDCELFIDGKEQENYRGWFNVLKELYADKTFPHWWLNEVFSKFIKEKKEFYAKNNMFFDDCYKKG